MNRNKNLPLTETFYYVLLALLEPAHGYVIMQKVEELSGGQVRMAAGTMYGTIENLLNKKLIASLPSQDSRRKIYGITDLGRRVLAEDYQRMKSMLRVTESLLQGELHDEKD